MAVRRRIGWTVLFGLAFGWVEAAVVVYLRLLYYPTGFHFPLYPLELSVLRIELVREAATLLVLMAVAGLAARKPWDRFATFCLAFGVWDIAYYLGLKITLDWPTSLTDWDILFLLPMPWVAPVYAPVAVALLLVVSGYIVIRLEDDGCVCRADWWTWLLGAVGVLLLLYSFMRDTAAGLGQAMPQPYPVPLLIVGLGLLTASLVRFVRQSRRGTLS